jgi:hypothetical protein
MSINSMNETRRGAAGKFAASARYKGHEKIELK